MGRFERKIQKRFKEETEKFDVWYEKNKDKFSDFENKNEAENMQNGDVKVKKCKMWVIPIAFIFVMVCVFLCFLPLILQKDKITTPSFFGDEAVIETKLSEEEYQSILQENLYLAKMSVVAQSKIKKTEDDSLVFVILNCELETQADYYFVTAQLEYNPYYEFVSKPEYDNFDKQFYVNDFEIGYKLAGLDSDDLYWYYLLTEKNGQKIYWEVHCFEESIDEFIELVFA